MTRALRGAWIVAAGLALAVALAGCGEPEPELEVPDRAAGQHTLDLADVLDVDAVDARLAEIAEERGVDVVAVAWEDDRATLGQAARGAEEVAAAWDADVALSAVAFPGDFTESDPEQRQRFFGVEADRLDIGRGLREQIVDDVVPGPAGDNDWTEAFLAAADALDDDLADSG